MTETTGRGKRSWFMLIVLMLAAFAAGYYFRGEKPHPSGTADEAPVRSVVSDYTCSMHPQIRQPRPGQCPLCGMDLIPASSDDSSADEGPREIRLSPRAIKLAEIQVAPVERKFVSAEIRMVGKVEYDETRLRSIASRVPGRLDRLYVDYTGVPVRKGDHLVSVYSPELISAQEELLQAIRTLKEMERGGLASIRDTARRTTEAAREKLRLWGLTSQQIEEIEVKSKPSDHLTIYAPIGGIVVEKSAVEGMYVETGTPIYTIADLTQLWVLLDAYESDLIWVRYGQQVAISTEAYPGEIFNGRIAFISPTLNDMTRTVKVRVNVPNPDGRLKPGMFVRGIVHAEVGAEGKVMDTALAGKWISPMHPEIIKDAPGICDVCGMPLVRAETLGYVSSDTGSREAPLVIPASAPLLTGKRAVVYVASPDKDGVFEGREIVLGPRAGNYYLVREGLTEGENVVVHGNFKIDSAIQILAKPSMMSPEGGVVPPDEEPHALPEIPESAVPEQFRAQLDDLYSAYFAIHEALSQDDHSGARERYRLLLDAVDQVDSDLLTGQAHEVWMKERAHILKTAHALESSEDIQKAREHFQLLSDSFIAIYQGFGASDRQPVLRFHCPMAFGGRGGDWLQNHSDVENPYYGASMFRCGELVK